MSRDDVVKRLHDITWVQLQSYLSSRLGYFLKCHPLLP